MAEWRGIEGFPGYEVSRDGQIRSLSRKVLLPCGQVRSYAGKVLSPSFAHGGYPQVNLRRDGVAYPVRVHCVVAATFIGPRPDGCEVRHLDGNPSNAHEDNLAYGTPAENSRDKFAHGTIPKRARHPQARLCEADVATIRSRLSEGEPQHVLAKDFGVCRTTISAIATGRSWPEADGITQFIGRAA